MKALLVILTCLATAVSAWAQSPGLWHRVANSTLHLPVNLEDPTALPPTLADTGAFSDLVHLTPNPGIVPYEVNVPLWSDGAEKQRWFSLPDTNLTVGFQRELPWEFPAGTIWIKHFELPLKVGDPSSARRIETRFLVRTIDGAYGVTYRWDESQTNATLVSSEGRLEDIDVEQDGETHTQVWHYPSRSECLQCHARAPGWSLGFNTPQLNRDANYGGITTNQIAALSQVGYFAAKVTNIHTLRALAPATNTAWSLEYRVRSYLAANCAQCHQPGTECLAKWDARIFTPTSAALIVNGPLVYPVNKNPDARVLSPSSPDRSMMLYRIAQLGSFHMPPIATTVVNVEAVHLLTEWITNSLADYQTFADWQKTFFNSTDVPAAAPDADPDGDGAVNQLEYLVGTNPFSGGDAWRISIQPNASLAQIRFPRLANRAFEVQWTTDLQDTKSWAPLDHPDNRPFFSSTGSQALIEDPITSQSARFYRVRVYEP